ncbi:MAG: heme lyase CcmF/NrfE family subunit [Acidobacteriota bacterium]|jgi:cytochrome c-type biogenesis protein CcmF
MAFFGSTLLLIALVAAVWSILASVLGAGTRSASLVQSGERAAIAAWGLIVTAAGALVWAFLNDRYDIKFVASFSNRHMDWYYKATALWAGQAGSLLLWVAILATFTVVVILQNQRRNRVLMPWVTATLSSIVTFFLVLINFNTNPFETLPGVPADGNGMNPLLQNPYMVIHPPMLYLGYVGMAVPYAFAMAALFSGRLDDTWIRTTRRWTLFAWFFLGSGILLGGYWAYLELGWGGYWAWDPVENAALLPWLTATAFLHSVMIQEKKGMLKIWNLVLILTTFALSIFGTFLTRSGVVSSVHAFAQSGWIGPIFVGFLGAVVMVSLGFLLYRLPDLKTEHRLESLVSRESTFLFNNLLFVGSAFSVLWGTMFPVVTEFFTGSQITVGPPFFNKVNVPIALALIVLTGIGPLIAWRRSTPKHLWKSFFYPLLGTLITAVVLIVAGVRRPLPLMGFSFSGFVIFTILLEFFRGTMARHRTVGTGYLASLVGLTLKNRRRYGGYLVHLGMMVLFIGITASQAFQTEITANVGEGETFDFDGYTLQFAGLTSTRTPNVERVVSKVHVFKGDRAVDTLHPERRFYSHPEQSTSEVDRYTPWTGDLYLVFIDFDPRANTAIFKAYSNPLVRFVWTGWMIVIFGTGIAVLPQLQPVSVRVAGPERARAAGRA